MRFFRPIKGMKVLNIFTVEYCKLFIRQMVERGTIMAIWMKKNRRMLCSSAVNKGIKIGGVTKITLCKDIRV